MLSKRKRGAGYKDGQSEAIPEKLGQCGREFMGTCFCLFRSRLRASETMQRALAGRTGAARGGASLAAGGGLLQARTADGDEKAIPFSGESRKNRIDCTHSRIS